MSINCFYIIKTSRMLFRNYNMRFTPVYRFILTLLLWYYRTGRGNRIPILLLKTNSKLNRQNKHLKDGTTTSKLMAELWISGKPPSEFPVLQIVVRNGGRSFKQRLLPDCKSEKTRWQSMSLSENGNSLALRSYHCVCT